MFASLPGQARPRRARARDPRLSGSGSETFAQLRALNADGPAFSFFDGPVTANKSLGVHTAWGRTLKDVFQRYKALRGYHQRYQNGFDCQGLWIEVGVERELGLNSKREIEEFGLAEFARRCREVVVRSSQRADARARSGSASGWTGATTTSPSPTRTSSTSGASSRSCTSAAGSSMGHRSTEWCPRCGTSISAHELHGHYEDRTDPSLYVRFPLLDRDGRVDRRLDDDAVDAARQRRRGRQSRGRLRAARERRVGRRARCFPDEHVHEGRQGRGARRAALRRARSTRSARAPRSSTA